MKIIGTTHNAYLVAVTPYELLRMSDHDAVAQSYNTPNTKLIGCELKLTEIWDHLHGVQQTDKERAKIAESLRAAATLIENTPDTLKYPPTPAPTAAGQETVQA